MKINAIYRREGQTDRNIEVLVFYKNEDVEKRTRSKSPTVEIIVRNDATTGISSDEIDALDKISIPPRRGMVTKWMRMEIINQNAGFLRLECK